jgi:membrane associated rhomboid family serine protease
MKLNKYITLVRKFPYVTLLFLGVIVLVFAFEVSRSDKDQFIHNWGFIPYLFDPQYISSWRYLVTGAFVHISVISFITNAVFFWFFGSKIEQKLGHSIFLLTVVAGIMLVPLGLISIIKSTVNIPIVGLSYVVSMLAGVYCVFAVAGWHGKVDVPIPLYGVRRIDAWVRLLAVGFWVGVQPCALILPFSRVLFNWHYFMWIGDVVGLVLGIAVGLISLAIKKQPDLIK